MPTLLQVSVIFARVLFMEIKEIARDIHRKRSFANSGSNITQAVADVLIHQAYSFKLDISSFDDPAMSLRLTDEQGRTVTVVGSSEQPFKVSELLAKSRDIIVFALGEGLSFCDILGWIPAEMVLQAPFEDFSYLVEGQFLFDMPETFSFIVPDLEILRVWDYNENAWWINQGIYLYDNTAEEQIRIIDAKLSS